MTLAHSSSFVPRSFVLSLAFATRSLVFSLAFATRSLVLSFAFVSRSLAFSLAFATRSLVLTLAFATRSLVLSLVRSFSHSFAGSLTRFRSRSPIHSFIQPFASLSHPHSPRHSRGWLPTPKLAQTQLHSPSCRRIRPLPLLIRLASFFATCMIVHLSRASGRARVPARL